MFQSVAAVLCARLFFLIRSLHTLMLHAMRGARALLLLLLIFVLS
jgi:hypothetical protein